MTGITNMLGGIQISPNQQGYYQQPYGGGGRSKYPNKGNRNNQE